MTTIELSGNQIAEAKIHTELLKSCPELDYQTTVDLQRTFRKLEKKLEELQDIYTTVQQKLNDKFKKAQNKEKYEDIILTMADQMEISKELEKVYKSKYEVDVHLLKISTLPKDPKTFGFKEGTKKENYYDGYLGLLDILILEDEKYDEAIKPKLKIDKK